MFDISREDRQIYLTLQETCRSIRNEIDALESQCATEMEKRFGKGISFEVIEAFAVNRTLEEMKENARRDEEKRYRRIRDKNGQLKAEKKLMRSKIEANTAIMDKRTSLEEEKMRIRREMRMLQDKANKVRKSSTDSQVSFIVHPCCSLC